MSDDFDRIFDSFYSGARENRRKTAVAGDRSLESFSEGYRKDVLPAGPQDEYMLQSMLRPWFGKEGLNETPIGAPPEFAQVDAQSRYTVHHHICTFFVDIKGSTRLNLIYPIDQVFAFKDAVIKTCVETIRSFDGCVHRIMGDAVMAFFAGGGGEKEDAIADAVNCAVTLRTLLERSIKPWLQRNGVDPKDFGFRVGCDFGDDGEVLWGGFGFSNVGEVSATGLSVDMASKLQGLARKNEAMLGQGLIDFVNWPNRYGEVKESERNGEKKKLPVVTPNLSDNEGNALNYRMRHLSYHRSLRWSALPPGLRAEIERTEVIANPQIRYRCLLRPEGERTEYISGSKFLRKNESLEFEVRANTRSRLKFPLQVKFSKTNHGPETPEEERDVEQRPERRTLVRKKIGGYRGGTQPYSCANIGEATLYRGLHTMKCEVTDAEGRIQFRDWIAVLIK